MAAVAAAGAGFCVCDGSQILVVVFILPLLLLLTPAFFHTYAHHPQTQEHSSHAHLAHCNLSTYSSLVYDDSLPLFNMPSVGGSAPPQPTAPNGIYNVLMTGNSMATGGIPTASSSANLNGTSTTASGEEISTIFVVGFPDDMQEREFQNMFIFSPGFEAATLKIPSKEQEEDINSNGNGSSNNNNRKQIVSNKEVVVMVIMPHLLSLHLYHNRLDLQSSVLVMKHWRPRIFLVVEEWMQKKDQS